jgi:hypothetical protein
MHSAEQNHLGAGTENAGDLAGGSLSAPRRRRHWGRWILAFAVIVLLPLVFAPQIVAWSPLRHELPRLRMPGFKGHIRVGRAMLSWWGPTELWDLELDAPDGKPFYKVAKVTEFQGAWGSVFRREDPIESRLEQPVVILTLRPDGSNVEDALAPVLDHPIKSPRKKSFNATGGSLTATDTVTGRVANWKDIAMQGTVDPQGSTPNRVQLSASLAESSAAKQIEVDFTWSNPSDGLKRSQGKWDLGLRTTDLPLTALGPLLGRFASDLDLSGMVTTHVHLVSSSDPAANGNVPVSGDWQLTTQNLQVACPSRMGDERLALDKADFAGRFSREGSNCLVETLKLTTDVCRLEGSGSIPLHPADATADSPAKDAAPLDANFKLHGDVDLVALANHLPNTLKIREGTKLTEGRITFEAGSRQAEQGTVWTGNVETSRIAALVAGEQVAWDEPLKFKFALHREQHDDHDRTQIDSVELLSDIIHLTGKSNGDALHLDGHCDLEQVIKRLGQFIDTDKQELRGKLSLAADITRDAEGLVAIDGRVDAENVLVRRLVSRMVERRAGDLPVDGPGDAPGDMPGNAQPEGPLPDAPGLGARSGQAPAGPLDRRQLRRQALAERKAERQAKREMRREQREIRKQTDEIVHVPVEEWQTLWDEPHLKLTLRSRLHPDPLSLELVQLGAESDGLTLRASGSVAEMFSRCVVELDGEADYDLARLIERVRDTVGPHLQIVGKNTRQFSLKGPLRSPADETAAARPIVPLELSAKGGVSWQQGDLFGIVGGAGDIDLTLAQGIVSMRPLDMAVSGGRFKLAPRLILTGRPALVEIPAGPVIQNVVLTDELCDSWLKYVAPIVAHATRTEGRVSLALDETRLPLMNPASADVSGRLSIEGLVLPGPLFDEVSRFVGGIASGIDGGPLRDWLAVDRPLVQIARQEVEFKVHDRRIYHGAMDFVARGIVIRTHGSVGLDQSLDLVAEITLSNEILSRARFLGSLQGRPLEIPIQGTLRKPRLAKGGIGRLAEQLGQTILDGILNSRGP